MNQIPLVLEQPVNGIGQTAGDLIHSQSIGNGRDPAIWTRRVDNSISNRTMKRRSP